MSLYDDDHLVGQAAAQAEAWLNRSYQLMTSAERKTQRRMAGLITHPMDRVILSQLIDQGFRSRDRARVADQIRYIFNRHGLPDFFSPLEKLLAHAFRALSPVLPALLVPPVIHRIMEETSAWILPGDRERLYSHLDRRTREGVRMNINHLGEAVLGEDEARTRLMRYLEDLKSPSVECISVKISTLCPQIQPLAFEHTVELLIERLSMLYRAAAESNFTRHDGSEVTKLVYLDMEEFKDLELTAEAFRRTLDREEFHTYQAGIALQAYLPDSGQIQRDLTEWAIKRTAAGGSPIRIRIVKGANMEMERFESSQRNWPLAPYGTKAETDANYKRMVEYGMRPENIEAVRVGIASHNLFDLALAYKLAARNGVSEHLSFEMLEGMADHIRRAMAGDVGDFLLYAPVAGRDQFINAIAYLFRRLDENTGPGNFLRYAPSLTPGDDDWNQLKEQFASTWTERDNVSRNSNRTQDRTEEDPDEQKGTCHTGAFVNEPDTDWSMRTNRKWADQIRASWMLGPGDAPHRVPLVVAGRQIYEGREAGETDDPSRFGEKICVVRYVKANEEDISSAISVARDDPDGWRDTDLAHRHAVLSKVAGQLRRSRGDLIGAAAAETGKIFSEADPEVSEAVDFAEYYPWSAIPFDRLKSISFRGRGVGVVISPWNFPIAIPAGGILASLAAGNTVIFKPASTAVLVGWQLCQCFWKAGVSRQVLQFLPCDGTAEGRRLTEDPGIDYVILTGGTDTGMGILRSKPDMCLLAETGGKNATIVTAMADRDQAVGNVIHSAFSNSGQKCSATSLLVLEREVYGDPVFKKQLLDAAASYRTGSAWDFMNRMGPLIRPPEKDLAWALTELEEGESWALAPRNPGGNPHIWTPGVKWGVRPGSRSHMTEFFGPVLSVLCAEDLEHAVEIVNMTGYGLTSALESLDLREQEKWASSIEAGNLYINRGTTGAVVLRQPFGGMGKSAIGGGTKVGGPNYVVQLMEAREDGSPETGTPEARAAAGVLEPGWEERVKSGADGASRPDLDRTIEAVRSCLYQMYTEFKTGKDYFTLRGQDNIIRYLPAGRAVIRVQGPDTLFEILTRAAAARIAGCRVKISLSPDSVGSAADFLDTPQGGDLIGNSKVVRQSDQDFSRTIPDFNLIRYAAPDRVPRSVFAAAAEHGVHVARDPVVTEGRVELLHYLKEQSLCVNYHRYGNLGDREKTKDP